MNVRNNVNGVGTVGRTEAFALKDGALTDVQDRYVRKVVDTLHGFDNTYYEVCNEPYFAGVTREWHRHIAKTISDAEAGLAVKHLISQNYSNGSKKIEDPDPRPGTNNWYKESSYRGGSYVACADPAQPGVKAIRDYLATLPYKTFNDGNCAPGTFYLVNNYDPGYAIDGTPQQLGAAKYVLPPQVAPNIATALAASNVSWKWYSGGRTASGIDKDLYCPICDPLTHSTAVMTSALRANLQDLAAFFRDLDDEKALPSVSFVIPPNPESGHPA
jgi:hypothetical protein